MKTKEREGAKKGGYRAVFAELIRPGNKIGTRTSKNGVERLMFRLQPVDDKEKLIKGPSIPYSVVWDTEDSRAAAVFGALGIPIGRVRKAMKQFGSVEKTLIWLEKEAKAKAMPVGVYVREDAGFGSGIKPTAKNSPYPVRFAGIVTRDQETKLPKHYYKAPKTFPSKSGKGSFTTFSGNMFNVDFEVLAGPQKNARIRKEYFYAIVKDEEDEWIVDADSREGADFKKLLTFHKINTDTIDPDRDFKDPENGTPELEKRMLKRAETTVMLLTINDKGWPTELKTLPPGMTIEGVETVPAKALDIGGDNTYRADPELVTKLFAMIDRRVKKHAGRTAWTEEGKLSKDGKSWLTEKGLPTSFEALSNVRVEKYIEKLKTDFPMAS